MKLNLNNKTMKHLNFKFLLDFSIGESVVLFAQENQNKIEIVVD